MKIVKDKPYTQLVKEVNHTRIVDILEKLNTRARGQELTHQLLRGKV